MYIILHKFIAPSQRNDAHNKSNLRIKPNSLDPVKKGIELRLCCRIKYIMVFGDKDMEPLLLSGYTIHRVQGLRISAGERSKSVEGRY